jgi:hypothetical protein
MSTDIVKKNILLYRATKLGGSLLYKKKRIKKKKINYN